MNVLKSNLSRREDYKSKLKDILYSHGIYPACRGVYRITNKINGKFYIGSSNSIYKRFAIHLLDLEYQKHCNSRLTNDYKEYGKDVFILDIVERCPSSGVSRTEIYNLEQKHMDILKPTYNIQLTVEIPNDKKQNSPVIKRKIRILKCVEPEPKRYITKRQRRNRSRKRKKQ